MLQWIKKYLRNKFVNKSEFELVFSFLKKFGHNKVSSSKRTYELLKKLNKQSPKEESDELISELKKIKYGSNTNSVFYFYFPIISHILFYKPEYEKEILGIIIGPNFANGEEDVDGMINVIQGAMKFKLNENSRYLTKESKLWIMTTLPKMKSEVKREIEICWKELNE